MTTTLGARGTSALAEIGPSARAVVEQGGTGQYGVDLMYGPKAWRP